jgi:hypothetical protein
MKKIVILVGLLSCHIHTYNLDTIKKNAQDYVSKLVKHIIKSIALPQLPSATVTKYFGINRKPTPSFVSFLEGSKEKNKRLHAKLTQETKSL